jgi:hypothetical protein
LPLSLITLKILHRHRWQRFTFNAVTANGKNYSSLSATAFKMFKRHQRQRIKINVILFGFKNYFFKGTVS